MYSVRPVLIPGDRAGQNEMSGMRQRCEEVDNVRALILICFCYEEKKSIPQIIVTLYSQCLE